MRCVSFVAATGIGTALRKRARGGQLNSPVRVEKRLGGSFFLGVRSDHLHVFLPQLLRSLGYPRAALLVFLLPSPGREHLRVIQWRLRSMSG
jgi:hypothetical protein